MVGNLPDDINTLLDDEAEDREADLYTMVMELAYIDDGVELPLFDWYSRESGRFRLFPPFTNLGEQPTFVWRHDGIYKGSDFDAQGIAEALLAQIVDDLFLPLESAEAVTPTPIYRGGWLHLFHVRTARVGPQGVQREAQVDVEAGFATYTFVKDGKELKYKVDLSVAVRPTVDDAVQGLVDKLAEAFGHWWTIGD